MIIIDSLVPSYFITIDNNAKHMYSDIGELYEMEYLFFYSSPLVSVSAICSFKNSTTYKLTTKIENIY